MSDEMTLTVNRCTMQIKLEPYFSKMPIPKIRRLMLLLFEQAEANEDSIRLLGEYLTAKKEETGAIFNEARAVCGNDFESRVLLKGLKTAEKEYERYSKITELYTRLSENKLRLKE